jgi:hypothetical protein
MYYYDVVRYSSSNVTSLPYKSNGQHLFNLLLFTGCSSGSNMDWDGLLGCCDVIDSFMDDITYVRDVEVCMYSMVL